MGWIAVILVLAALIGGYYWIKNSDTLPGDDDYYA